MGGQALSLAIKNGIILAIVIVIAHVVARNYNKRQPAPARRACGGRAGGRRGRDAGEGDGGGPSAAGGLVAAPAPVPSAGGGYQDAEAEEQASDLLDYVFGPGGTTETFAAAAGAGAAPHAAPAPPAAGAGAGAAAPAAPQAPSTKAAGAAAATPATTLYAAAYDGAGGAVSETFDLVGGRLGGLQGFDSADMLFSPPLA